MSYGIGYVFLFPAGVLDLDSIKSAKYLGIGKPIMKISLLFMVLLQYSAFLNHFSAGSAGD